MNGNTRARPYSLVSQAQCGVVRDRGALPESSLRGEERRWSLWGGTKSSKFKESRTELFHVGLLGEALRRSHVLLYKSGVIIILSSLIPLVRRHWCRSCRNRHCPLVVCGAFRCWLFCCPGLNQAIYNIDFCLYAWYIYDKLIKLILYKITRVILNYNSGKIRG